MTAVPTDPDTRAVERAPNDGDRIVDVRFAEHALRLPAPIELGPLRIAQRRYTSVEIRTQDGRVGTALAQSREAPLSAVGEQALAPLLLDLEARAVQAHWERLHRSTMAIGRVGLVVRAISLVDVALWDLLGQRARLPLHELLGGYRRRIPLTYVAGSPGDADRVGPIVDAAERAAHAGHRTIKVARTAEPELTHELLRRLDERLPAAVQVQVDANWVWRSVGEALAELRTWPASRILWVEDPFPPEDEHALAALRGASPVAVAAGDELTDRAQAMRLLDARAVDVLRLDVMTIGGVTAALPLIAAAHRHRVPVSFHIAAEASVQLACGVPGVRDVESFDRGGNPFDEGHRLVAGGPAFAGGWCEPSSEPGLGLALA